MADLPPTPFPDDDAPKAKTTARKRPPASGASGSSGARRQSMPPGSGATGDTGATGPARRTPTPKLQKDLENLFSGVPVVAFSFMGDPYMASLFGTRGPALAEDLYKLAQTNASVRRVLESMVKGSAMGGVALSAAALIIPAAQHYGLLPGSDPFATMYPPVEGTGNGGPIVPPPPQAATSPPVSAASGGGAAPPGMAPTVPGPAAVSAMPVNGNGHVQ
jgi:hypothetical protein